MKTLGGRAFQAFFSVMKLAKTYGTIFDFEGNGTHFAKFLNPLFVETGGGYPSIPLVFYFSVGYYSFYWFFIFLCVIIPSIGFLFFCVLLIHSPTLVLLLRSYLYPFIFLCAYRLLFLLLVLLLFLRGHFLFFLK